MAPSDPPGDARSGLSAGPERDAADLALLIEAARAAAPTALKDFRLGAATAAATEKKPLDGSVVTAADHAVNDALRDHLRAARPDYGWLSEEDADDADRLSRDRLFLVDPIDGTRSFAEGRPEWCLSIAVAARQPVSERYDPVAAVIFAPALDRLFSAAAGAGARLNQAEIRVAPRDALDGARVLGTRSVRREEHWSGAAPHLALTYIHPIAYRLCLVAEGAYDGLIALGDTNEWDIAAGALIVAEAGGRAVDRAGQPYRLNAPKPRVAGSLAGAPALIAEIRDRLAPRES